MIKRVNDRRWSRNRISLCMASTLSYCVPVKYRKVLIDREVTDIITEAEQGIQERNDIKVEAISCDRDHIHLLCSAHTKIAPGRIVQIIKHERYFRENLRSKKSCGVESFGLMDIM